MPPRWLWSWALVVLSPCATPWAQVQQGGGGLSSFGVSAAAGAAPWFFEYSPRIYYSTIGPDGLPITFVPGMRVFWPGGPPPITGPSGAPPAPDPGIGVAGPWPPPGMVIQPHQVLPPALRPRKSDPARSSQLVTIGDRLFRAGNARRAAERYEQASRADPNSAAPHVRLAQIALLRGQFVEAANQYREAQAAEPGWLAHARDIESIYGEPGDFARQLARLESHLQASPNDRDAWLVLGAQWFLSGHPRRAADIFLRLTDRKPDKTLAAFLDATTPGGRALE